MSIQKRSLMHADVLIVGGGPVGSLLAIALARSGLSVIVVDRLAPETITNATFDGRTSAISYGSANVLRGVGIWPQVEEVSQPILDIKISQGHSSALLHYTAEDAQGHPMGYIIENFRLRNILYQKAHSFLHLSWLAPEDITEFTVTEAGVHAHLASGKEIQARVCFAADGRESQIRRLQGFETTQWPYDQTALVCVVEHTLPHNGVAYEHFLPTGPLAFLPMLGQRSSVVWTVENQYAPEVLALESKAVNQILQEGFGEKLGELHMVGKVWSYPLGVIFAHSYIQPRIALVGDAAHVIHPIAGQGLNMGIRDVAALAEVIVDAFKVGLDIGSLLVLEKYQRWRRFDNLTLTTVTDGLNRLFSNHSTVLQWLRHRGLNQVQHWDGARRFFTRHAMGMVGTLPRLVAGKDL